MTHGPQRPGQLRHGLVEGEVLEQLDPRHEDVPGHQDDQGAGTIKCFVILHKIIIDIHCTTERDTINGSLTVIALYSFFNAVKLSFIVSLSVL